MSANPYPQQPAQPWMALPVPGAPGVETLARAISPEENEARGRASYLRSLTTVLLPMLVVLGLVVVLFSAWILRAAPIDSAAAWFVPLGTWLFVCVVGVGIGLPIGLAATRRRAEDELGLGRVLTVAWNQAGFSIAGLRGLRSVPFSDVRSVRRGGSNDWFVMIRLRVRFISAEPYIIALPGDLVPAWALDRLYSQGGAR
ncbi:hypothetical protein [Galactobacter valiniphilus]|uniref:hypothetical protein n=1 Tax=Galactobacter valiniphilus TaxID=2676122 RepID=UPI003736B14E